MLGGVTEGPVLPRFELLKEAGFEGVELISPNKLDRDEVLRARDKTGLVIHGVSGGQHWKDTLSDPDPQVVERGLAAIRQEFEDCKAYGGTTVLLVPAVVTKNVSYRDAYTRSQANIRKLIPDAERQGIKIAIEEVWNRFLLSPHRIRPLHRRIRQPLGRRLLRRRQRRRVRLPRRTGSASWASGSSRSTSRNTPRPTGSTTRSARARSTGPPSARRWSTSATRAGSAPRSPARGSPR